MSDEDRVGHANFLDREKEMIDRFRLVVSQYENHTVLAALSRWIKEEVLYTQELPELMAKFSKMMTWDKSAELKRFNWVPTLIYTRNGRCGEWAILFTGLLNALGYNARLVFSFEDHVWTEVWVRGEDLDGRWVHFDCTLSAPNNMDHPLVYRDSFKHVGLKVLAFASSGDVVDVTKRYFP